MDSAECNTSPTLIGRLQSVPQDQSAWTTFEQRYGNKIQQWCRRWGLQSSDADDLAQNVMLALSKQMRRFEYDPNRRFRSWLKTVAYRAWADFLEQQRRRAAISGDTVIMQLIDSKDVQNDFFQQLEEEWKRELLEEASKQVRNRVQPHTWETFQLLTRDGLTGVAVAERMGMKVGAVWVVKSKVQRMLQQEITKLTSREQSTRDRS